MQVRTASYHVQRYLKAFLKACRAIAIDLEMTRRSLSRPVALTQSN